MICSLRPTMFRRLFHQEFRQALGLVERLATVSQAGNIFVPCIASEPLELFDEDLCIGVDGHDGVFVAVDMKELDAGFRQRREVIDRIE